MPRIKIDYVVSFSSEDSDNKADSLLNWDVSKKKWLCSRGEPTSSVVLQLKSCTQISAVHIGSYHAALVEVLVGLSEKPNNPYEVLVPSSVFINPMDSRRCDNIERVRSFTKDQLCEATRNKRWDRVRVVCSQPYNKHCQYGLSFIHVHSPDETPTAGSTKATPFNIPLDTYSSDDEEFKPGELFAQHRRSQGANTSTDAQIRQATSQAIKNISDTAAKLVKTPIAKLSSNSKTHKDENRNKDRDRNTIMYNDEDERPHAKIDRIVQRHNDEKKDTLQAKENETKDKNKDKTKRDEKYDKDRDTNKRKDEITERDSKKDKYRSDKEERRKTNDFNNAASSSKNIENSIMNKGGERNKLKRTYSDRKDDNELLPGPKCSAPHALLDSVIFAMSGYENPRRASIRSVALAMGAGYRPNWTSECTHLICAFPNTPKLKTVRSDPQGTSCIAVRGEWVEECSRHMRVLPWQWFATEVEKRVERRWSGSEDERGDDLDTDDEIERVIQQKKRKKDKHDHSSDESKRKDNLPNDIKKNGNLRNDINENEAKGNGVNKRDAEENKSTMNMSSDSDVAFVKDERMQGNVTIQDTDSDSDKTDEDTITSKDVNLDATKLLPDIFDGAKFYVDRVFSEEDIGLVERYVTAYGGLVLKDTQLDDDTEIDYLISTTKNTEMKSTNYVNVEWIWRCHEEKRLCDVREYLL